MNNIKNNNYYDVHLSTSNFDLTDLLKVIFYAGKFSDRQFCAEELVKNALKTCKFFKNFVKLCQFIFLNACFSYFAFKSTHFAQVLENFAQMCKSSRK